jgi:hypothetical protein
VAFRSLVKSGDVECKGGFGGGDKFIFRGNGAQNANLLLELG